MDPITKENSNLQEFMVDLNLAKNRNILCVLLFCSQVFAKQTLAIFKAGANLFSAASKDCIQITRQRGFVTSVPQMATDFQDYICKGASSLLQIFKEHFQPIPAYVERCHSIGGWGAGAGLGRSGLGSCLGLELGRGLRGDV